MLFFFCLVFTANTFICTDNNGRNLQFSFDILLINVYLVIVFYVFRSTSTQQLQSITRSETEPVHTESLHKVMTEMTFDGLREEHVSNDNIVDLLDNLL